MALTRCKKCLMPTTRPDTAFVDGVCSACIAYKKRKEIDWASRQEDLLRILESAKPNADGYHCVVPSSGGKDSHWQVLKLIELGVRPLVVTATTCMLTEIGKANIRNLARYATTVEVTPNLRVRALLNRLGLELVGDVAWPEHVGIFSIPWRIAKQNNIELIFYGESPTVEYGGPMDALSIGQMTRRWITEFGQHLGMRPNDLVGQHGLRREDMADYQMPSEADMGAIQAYFLGHFYPWDSHRNARQAAAAGMSTPLPAAYNWWHGENVDSGMTGIHDFFCWLKHGFGRACAQLSIDIRNDYLSRDEAMAVLVERDGLFPFEYMGISLQEVLRHIGISQDSFIEICNNYLNKLLFVEERIEWGRELTLRDPEWVDQLSKFQRGAFLAD